MKKFIDNRHVYIGLGIFAAVLVLAISLGAFQSKANPILPPPPVPDQVPVIDDDKRPDGFLEPKPEPVKKQASSPYCDPSCSCGCQGGGSCVCYMTMRARAIKEGAGLVVWIGCRRGTGYDDHLHCEVKSLPGFEGFKGHVISYVRNGELWFARAVPHAAMQAPRQPVFFQPGGGVVRMRGRSC